MGGSTGARTPGNSNVGVRSAKTPKKNPVGSMCAMSGVDPFMTEAHARPVGVPSTTLGHPCGFERPSHVASKPHPHHGVEG